MVMTPFFLALMADIENYHGYVDHAQELLARAQEVVETTGEHVWDEQLAHVSRGRDGQALAESDGSNQDPIRGK